MTENDRTTIRGWGSGAAKLTVMGAEEPTVSGGVPGRELDRVGAGIKRLRRV